MNQFSLLLLGFWQLKWLIYLLITELQFLILTYALNTPLFTEQKELSSLCDMI